MLTWLNCAARGARVVSEVYKRNRRRGMVGDRKNQTEGREREREEGLDVPEDSATVGEANGSFIDLVKACFPLL